MLGYLNMNKNNREKQWLLEEKYQGIESSEFFADLEKLQSGTPLAYLIGNIPFLGTVITLESKPLIPRPETEYFTHWLLEHEIQNKAMQILDIFAGSGCIGVGILHNSENTRVDFAELKPNHIEQIQKNLHVNNISKHRYCLFQSDIFTSIPNQKYDIIIANPPYISIKRTETVESSVLNHEDPDALFAKDDGLFFIKEIILQGKNFLTEYGKIYIEFDPWQTELLENFCKEHSILHYTFHLDQYGKKRFIEISY